MIRFSIKLNQLPLPFFQGFRKYLPQPIQHGLGDAFATVLCASDQMKVNLVRAVVKGI